jgi:hypothetical protein
VAAAVQPVILVGPKVRRERVESRCIIERLGEARERDTGHEERLRNALAITAVRGCLHMLEKVLNEDGRHDSDKYGRNSVL